jgi:outer membrane protein assembly factor BamD
MKQTIVYHLKSICSKSVLYPGLTNQLKGMFRVLPAITCGLLLVSLLGIMGCDTPEKALKSTDINYKKAKAISWYNKKEYYKCIPVFEELIGLMKGRQSTEDLYYMYSMANFHQGDYMISAYHFKNFYDLYPNSEKAEECLYMYAKSYERLSPKPSLDQSYTTKALDAYQLFLNAYPNGKYINDVNSAVSEMRKKLEKKALNAAELYYRTSNFKAAATSFTNILKQFPDISEGEYVTLMIIKSNFEYAKNSIPSKKADRFERVIKSYGDFKDKFGQSKYLAEAAEFEHNAHYLAVKSAFDWAEVCALEERESNFNVFFREAKDNLPAITDKKETDEVTQLTEKGYFLIVKGNFQASEVRKNGEKLPFLEETVKTYYNFVDKYPRSRYSKEAEKMFNISTELLKKLKSNGQS